MAKEDVPSITSTAVRPWDICSGTDSLARPDIVMWCLRWEVGRKWEMKILERRVKYGKDGKEKDAAGRWLTSHWNNTRKICGLVPIVYRSREACLVVQHQVSFASHRTFSFSMV